MTKSVRVVLFMVLLFGSLGAQENQTSPPPVEESATPPKRAESHLPAYFLEELEKTEEEGEGSRFFREFVNMMITLGFIIGVLFLLLWVFKRMLHTRSQQLNVQSHIKILEQRSLTNKTTLFLLEIDEQNILIAESASGITHLTEYNRPETPSSFENLMTEKQQEREE